MGYSRTRSRNDLNDVRAFKFGTVASPWFLVVLNIYGPKEGKPSGGAVETSFYDYDPASFPFISDMNGAGVTTYVSSSRIWFNEGAMFDRVKSYESLIMGFYEPKIEAAIESKYTSSTVPFLLRRSAMTMTDVVTPRFSERSAKGGIFNSPMTSSAVAHEAGVDTSTTGHAVSLTWQTLSRVKYFSGQPGEHYRSHTRLYITIAGGSRDVWGIPESVLNSLGTHLDRSQLDPTSAINTAFGRVYEAEADLALFVAEFHKTASLLTSTAMRIAKLVKSVKSGRFLKLAPEAYKKFKASGARGMVATSSNIFADAWLEARYAWRPLLLDAQNAFNYLTGPQSTPRRTFRGFEHEQLTEDVDITISQSGYTYRFVGSLSSDKFVRAGCLTQIDPGWMTRRDLGLANPTGLAWELVPYSFVVDWFVNVRGFISHVNPAKGIEVISSWATKISDISLSGTCTITNSSTLVSKDVAFATRYVDKERDVDVCPTFVNLDINFDVPKLVDAVALLRRFKH